MILIPAIDIQNGKPVYSELGKDPIAIVSFFLTKKVSILHLVDIDGVYNKPVSNSKLLKKIIESTSIPCEVNPGNTNISLLKDVPFWQIIVGIQTETDLTFLNSAIQLYGKEKCTASFSFSNKSDIERCIQLANHCKQLGLSRFILRNEEKDGTLAGISLEEIKYFNEKVSCELIVSGGISSRDDVQALKTAGVKGAIIGKALYSGVLNL